MPAKRDSKLPADCRASPLSLKGNRDENDTEHTLLPDGYAGAERRTFTASSFAQTSKLVIESGDSAQSRQQATMEKEQWNDTRSLRHKVNTRTEKSGIRLTSLLMRRTTARRARTSTRTGTEHPALPRPPYRSRHCALIRHASMAPAGAIFSFIDRNSHDRRIFNQTSSARA